MNNISITQSLIGVIDAAHRVASFVKHNEYPEEGSDSFREFTMILDKLEAELKKIGFPVTREGDL